jgi:hypothetical protein
MSDDSEFETAALAFDGELTRFGRACEAVQRRALDSRKNLAKVAESLTEAAESEERLGPLAVALMTSLGVARERQEAQSLALRQRVAVVQERVNVMQALAIRYNDLMAEAAALNGLAQPIVELKAKGEPGSTEQLRQQLADFDARLVKSSEAAKELATESRAADFEDIAADAHALHQKLTSMHQKIRRLRDSITIGRSDQSDAKSDAKTGAKSN